MHNHHVASLTGTRTTLVITYPFRTPHRTILDVGLIGGRHVKTSHGSRCSKLAIPSQCIVMQRAIDKQAHTEEMWLVHPEVLYREGLQARLTLWRSDAIRASSVC
jgi:hypothetical protein